MGEITAIEKPEFRRVLEVGGVTRERGKEGEVELNFGVPLSRCLLTLNNPF